MSRRNKAQQNKRKSPDLLQKMDSDLRRLYLEATTKGLEESVRCIVIANNKDELQKIQSDVDQLGGRVRYVLHLINGIAAFVPITKMAELSAKDYVQSLEIVREHEVFRR